MKNSTIYSCSHCGAQTAKWQGRCLECGKWGTLSEDVATSVKKGASVSVATASIKLSEAKSEKAERLRTNIAEFDRVMGGGIVPGSLTLIGGDPGIGKSTLVMQVSCVLSQKDSVLYVSGEESAGQVRLRMDRLGLLKSDLRFLHEENVEVIVQTAEKEKPSVLVVDSIQTVLDSGISSEPGSVSQIRSATARLLEFAKKNNVAVLIIGHVTKEGVLGGPKTLEHLVDTVVYMEGDRQHLYRILRTAKNRFGSTSEVGLFDMQEKGLVEIKNPSEMWVSDNSGSVSGSVFSATMEGSRVFLLETQALVTKTAFGYPLRKTVGFDLNKLHLLVAVLTKHAGVQLGAHDIHVNIVGGLKVSDVSLDLAVCASVISALRDVSFSQKTLVLGEVGLGGEIRSIARIDERIKEAERQGFEQVVIPQSSRVKTSLKTYKIRTVRDLLGILK